MQVRHQHRPDNLVVGAFLVDDALQPGRNRADQAIGHEHAHEGADQGTADHAAENFGRLGDRPHGLDDPENGCDDAQGGEGVGEVLKGVGGLERLVVVLLELLFHHILDLVGILEVHGHHPQGVADEVRSEMILQHLGIFLENGALGRLLDVALQGDDALGLHRLGQLEQQRQQVLVVLLLPLRAAESLAQTAERPLHCGDTVRDQEGGDAGSADRHQFVRSRMGDDVEFAARDGVAAEHHAEQQDNADNLEHGRAVDPERGRR